MTWQEELRRHEQSLAAGKITDEEYHKRRDRILAEASSNAPPSDLDPDRTQVISRPGRPARPSRPVSRGVSAHDLRVQRDPVMLVTPPQARELFVAGPGPRARARLVLLLGLTVLALVAGGVWWFGQSRDEPTQAGTTEPATPPPTGVARLTLPGTVVPNTGRMSIQRANELQVLFDREADLLERSGVTEVDYFGSATTDYRYLAYAYPSADPDRAGSTTDTIAQIQEQLGLTPADVGEVPLSVQVSKLTNSDAAVLRALYTSGGSTIQICVLQVPTGDADALRTEFLRVLSAAVTALKPDA